MFLKRREEFIDNLLRLPVGVRRRIGRHSEDGRLGELIDQIDDYLQILPLSRDREGRDAVSIQRYVQDGHRKIRRNPSHQPNWVLDGSLRAVAKTSRRLSENCR